MKFKIKKTIGKTFELPKEIVLDLPLVSIIGLEEISIENHKGIIEYNEECVRLKTKIGTLKIDGKKMILKQMTNESVVVSGIIVRLEYLK